MATYNEWRKHYRNGQVECCTAPGGGAWTQASICRDIPVDCHKITALRHGEWVTLWFSPN